MTAPGAAPTPSAETAFVRALDARRPEAIAAVFAADGVLEVPQGRFSGARDITGYYSERFAKVGGSRHYLSELDSAELPGGGRRSDWNYLAVIGAGDAAGLLTVGSYRFLVDAEGSVTRLVVTVAETYRLESARLP